MRANRLDRPLDLMPRLVCCAAVILLANLLPVSPVFADPPARVGRISYFEGDVSFFAERNEGWRPARLNFPVTGKNSIWTNGPGRAEVRIGATAIRIDGNTVLDFAAVDDNATRLFLQRGTTNIRFRSAIVSPDQGDNGSDTIIVETNQGPLLLQTNGRYRIDAMPDGNETRILVFSGAARFDRRGAGLDIDNGKSLSIRVENDAASYVFGNASESSLDRWAESRDTGWDDTHQRYARDRRISPQMTGYEDLDTSGNWIDDREYGRLWTPRVVVAGWAPYRYGSWAYVQPWGWTWIDDAPWGFAPFHYGRWVQRHARWYWWPGAYRHRPVYAPALVGWHGNGNWNVSISIGGGLVGWFPLAPREHYVPQYTSNATYIRNINNITNNVTIVNPPARFANQGRGSTVVGNNVIVSGESVWRTARIDNGQGRMTKPALDQAGADISLSTATLVPPAAPVITRPVQHKPAQLPMPQPGSIGSDRLRPVANSDSTAGIGNTVGVTTQESRRPMAVSGEAPRQRAANVKPAEIAPNDAMRQETSTTMPSVRPVKPRPVAAPALPFSGGATIPTGNTPASAGNTNAGRPQNERTTEQRVDGPVRLKEQGDRGARPAHAPIQSPDNKEQRAKQPVAEATQKQHSGAKDAHTADKAVGGESINKNMRQ